MAVECLSKLAAPWVLLVRRQTVKCQHPWPRKPGGGFYGPQNGSLGDKTVWRVSWSSPSDPGLRLGLEQSSLMTSTAPRYALCKEQPPRCDHKVCTLNV
eukprot:CAMPEP_0174364026 /NCGR_PEP_ID=MMETSP0811_2-20130205/71228_1 /TAXON_ID=73025 ORGANISM="Eutreptiella gymnastica-like, Strain CCMP1594" /NCGR_SAMPLE_ID=MMETSP0811_2 /ASSEMBLY_ACC=CAM_ASM_000667 /LENGTH=98 /DNA_ID=CAMNT_0015503289 /DNA_START=91 /DNA_END=387 /DNA_ORIENTATION=-